jgi:hypothetical protein
MWKSRFDDRGTARSPGRLAFASLYALAFLSTCQVLVAPLLVTLAVKVESLFGIEQAPGSLALVAGIGALVAMVAQSVLAYAFLTGLPRHAHPGRRRDRGFHHQWQAL